MARHSKVCRYLKKRKKKLEKPQWTAEGQIASEQSEQHLKTMEKECRRPQSRLTMQMGSWVARLLFFFLFVSFTAIHKEQEKRRRTKPNGLECRPSISFPPPLFFFFCVINRRILPCAMKRARPVQHLNEASRRA